MGGKLKAAVGTKRNVRGGKDNSHLSLASLYFHSHTPTFMFMGANQRHVLTDQEGCGSEL